jgi:hypothetical protein
MSNNEIVKVNSNNSLARVGNLISLTNMLLNEINSKGIVLYNLSEYNLQQKTEIAFICFIKKNIWLFLPQIITLVKNESLSFNPYPSDFNVIIKKNDFNYEYPRSFFRKRGSGTTLVDSEYDRKIHEKNEMYIFCSPKIDKIFESLVFQNITSSIAGKIITEYADTSVGLVLGLKYKWTYNE